jgi:ribonuclease D
MLLREAKQLRDLARELRDLGSFALDTEFIREKTYRPRLCLVQIATREKAFLVDPFLVGDLTPLFELIFDSQVEKTVHAGEQDMEIFFALGRALPRNVVDTQVAAALAGHGESVSYARLVEQVLGVKLRKVETFTDWSKRPLTPEQIEYALDDVRYLHPLMAALKESLERSGRKEWLGEELKFYEDRSLYVKDPGELYKKVRAAVKLEPRELAVLRELTAWREEEAERMDRPRGRIILDEILVELSRRSPRSLDSIGAVRGIHPQLLRRSGHEILRRVERALSLPPSELPPPIERRADDPELSLVVDLLEVALRAQAAAAQIAPAYLGTRRDLAELAQLELKDGGSSEKERDQLRILSGWRRRLVGESLLLLLKGKSHIAIDHGGAKVEVVKR